MTKHNNYNNYTEKDWRSLAALARQQSVLNGFYNDNYRLVHDANAFLFRFARPDEEQLDPRPFKEHDVYKMLEGKGLPIPELLYVAPDLSFQVQKFVEGALVDEIYPPGQNITENHINKLAAFYKKIAALDIDVSQYIAADWPQAGPPLTFFEKLLETAWLTYTNHQSTHGHIYEYLRIPADPFEPFLRKAGELSKRPWRLIHADVHRANMIEDEQGDIIIIDWELALYGDILYCVASHLHRCRFFPDEKERAAKSIYEKLPKEFQVNFMKDLSFYLDYEALKSVIGDTVRFPTLVKQKRFSSDIMYELSVYYADNLNRISGLLGTRTTKPEKALEWFHEWSV